MPRYSICGGGTCSRSPIWAIGLRPAVRLDEADHHVDALPLQPVALLEHVVGLADPGGEAEIDLQPAALLLADQRQKVLRVREQPRNHRWLTMACLPA